MMQLWLADVLRAAGLPVREIAGWKARGHGEFSASGVLGVICHHTAGSSTGAYPSESVVVNGRPGLAGPLANLGLDRNGVWIIVAAGQAWHAGTGSAPWCPTDQGNNHCLGVEAESVGTRDDWTDAQRGSYPRGVAALLSHLGLPASRAIGHKEWAPTRKVDPAFWDLNAFRADVARWQSSASARPSVPSSQPRTALMEDDDVILEPAPNGRSVTMAVPAGATELVISQGWIPMRVDSVAFFGPTPAQGVNQRWRTPEAKVLAPARPWQIPVPAGSVTAEVNYVLAENPAMPVYGTASFRAAS